MGLNYLSILNCWSLGMDKKFHPTLYNECNYLCMLGLKLIIVSKKRSKVILHTFSKIISCNYKTIHYTIMYIFHVSYCIWYITYTHTLCYSASIRQNMHCFHYVCLVLPWYVFPAYIIYSLHHWPLVRGIHWSPVDYPHKGTVMHRVLPCDNITMHYIQHVHHVCHNLYSQPTTTYSSMGLYTVT